MALIVSTQTDAPDRCSPPSAPAPASLPPSAQAARLDLLRLHVKLAVAASDRELGALLSARICVVQGFAPHAAMPLLDKDARRKCPSMMMGEHGFREGLPEESVRVDALIDGLDKPASMWTASKAGPSQDQKDRMEKVSPRSVLAEAIQDIDLSMEPLLILMSALLLQLVGLVLDAQFDVVVLMGAPTKEALLRVLGRRGGSRHVGEEHGCGAADRVIEWGEATIFTTWHPQNLLPSWSSQSLAMAYARGMDDVISKLSSKLGRAYRDPSQSVLDMVRSLGGKPAETRGGQPDDPIELVRRLHKAEQDLGRELGWQELPPMVVEHMRAEGIRSEEAWRAMRWQPSTIDSQRKLPWSVCKYFLACQGASDGGAGGSEGIGSH